MKYQIGVSHEAEKILDRLDRRAERRLRARIAQLGENPLDPRLSARAGIRKSRVGDWRILFTVDRNALAVEKDFYTASNSTDGFSHSNSKKACATG